jgi:hypothetical protein
MMQSEVLHIPDGVHIVSLAMRSLVLATAILAALSAVTQCQERRLLLRPSAPMPAVQIP